MSTETLERIPLKTKGSFRPSAYLELWQDGPFSSHHVARVPYEDDGAWASVTIPEEDIVWRKPSRETTAQEIALKAQYLDETHPEGTSLELVGTLGDRTIVVTSLDKCASYMIEQLVEHPAIPDRLAA